MFQLFPLLVEFRPLGRGFVLYNGCDVDNHETQRFLFIIHTIKVNWI